MKNILKNKENAMLNTFPWGVVSGICAIIWSFLLIGIIAVFIVSGMMYVEVGGDDGLRDAWWLTVLIIAEIVTGLGCAGSLLLYRRRESKNKIQ